METFSALLAICAENSPVPGEFPAQRPVTRSFDVFFDLHPDKRLSKQWWGWWFETPSHSLWRHRNVLYSSFCAPARIRWSKNVINMLKTMFALSLNTNTHRVLYSNSICFIDIPESSSSFVITITHLSPPPSPSHPCLLSHLLSEMITYIITHQL